MRSRLGDFSLKRMGRIYGSWFRDIIAFYWKIQTTWDEIIFIESLDLNFYFQYFWKTWAEIKSFRYLKKYTIMISRYVEIHFYLPCFSLMLQKAVFISCISWLLFYFRFCWRSLSAWLAARMWSRMRSGPETWRGPQTSRWDPSWSLGSWCRGVSRTRWPATWRRPTEGRGTGGTCAGHRPWFQSCFLNLITMGLVLNDSLFLFCRHCILHWHCGMHCEQPLPVTAMMLLLCMPLLTLWK